MATPRASIPLCEIGPAAKQSHFCFGLSIDARGIKTKGLERVHIRRIGLGRHTIHRTKKDGDWLMYHNSHNAEF